MVGHFPRPRFDDEGRKISGFMITGTLNATVRVLIGDGNVLIGLMAHNPATKRERWSR